MTQFPHFPVSEATDAERAVAANLSERFRDSIANKTELHLTLMEAALLAKILPDDPTDALYDIRQMCEQSIIDAAERAIS